MSISMRHGSLAPGGVVGDGRYRLLAQLGVDERGHAHLWRARDGQLRRDVALTVLVGDPRDAEATRQARRTLERAAHAAKFHHAQVARVLDVLSLGNGIASNEGLLGIVVSEWSRGTDLIDVVDDGPVSASSACRMLEPLVEAVEKAHHAGLVLGVDHPQRIRRGQDGTLRLAFPGPLPDATLRDDIKALGGILYILLTGRWPLDGGPTALPTAPRGVGGRVAAPRQLQPKVPADLSALAVRTLSDGGDGGVRTASAFRRVLHHVASKEEHQAAVRRGVAEPDVVEDEDGGVWTTRRPQEDARRRRKVAIGATALVLASVAIIAWIGLSLISVFQGDDSAGPSMNVAESSKKAAQAAKKKTEKPNKPAASAPVKPQQVQVFNPLGNGDWPGKAPLAIDGNPKTTWTTDQYDQQFPAYKQGVGLAAQFDQPTQLTKIHVSGGSEGTQVEVRTADQPQAPLNATKVVGKSTLKKGDTDINLKQPAKAKYVIVWITKLSEPDANNGGKFQTAIGDLKFLGAANQ